MSIKLIGGLAAVNYLKQSVKDIKKASNVGIRESTLMMVSEVKQSIAGRKAEPRSVDHGFFLNSIDYKLSFAKGMVFTDIVYAPPLEYGTTKIQPRRHFRNSLSRNRTKINRILQEKINKKVRLRGRTKK